MQLLHLVAAETVQILRNNFKVKAKNAWQQIHLQKF